jgi:pimeloyl-ACP methyl ester carboxylesterase
MAMSKDMPGPVGRTIHANGLDIYYESHGEGPPLLLIHAGSLTADSWRPYLPALAEHFQVVTPDSRGHGRSGKPARAMSYRLLAEDLAAFVDALGIHKPLVAGFSDGGQVALEVGMRHPDLPRALVVGGAQFRFSVAYLAWVRDAVGDESSPEVDTARFARGHPEWAGWLQSIYGPEAWKTVLARCKPMWTTPLDYTPADFARVVAPALVLLGDRDETVSIEEAADMYRLLPRAELAIVPGATHGAFFGAKAAVFQSLMLDFLLRQGGAGTGP